MSPTLSKYAAVAVCAVLVSPAALPAANVTVNASIPLSAVNTNAFGVHTSVYDNQNGNAALPALLQQGGITTLRYPGGGYADVFHWSVTRPSLGSDGLSPWFGGPGNSGYIGPQTDFGQFAQLLERAQLQAVITIDFGSGLLWGAAHTNLVVPGTNGQPQEAAAWVAYANASSDILGTTNDVVLGVDVLGNDWKTAGYWSALRAASPLSVDDGYNFLRINHTAPFGIQYWEIGNETFGTGYYDGSTTGYSVNYAAPYTGASRKGISTLSPSVYGQMVAAFSAAMKAVDPTVKIGAVVSTPPGDYSWDIFSGQRWTPQVLAQCASNIDFVIAHWYPNAGNNSDGSSLLSQVGTTVPFMINGKTTGLDSGTNSGLRDWINSYRPSDGTNVQIFITEFGYTGSVTNSLSGRPIFGPVNALLAADCYASWIELGVANVDWLEMNKNTFLGDANPLVRGAAYYAVQLVRSLAAPGDSFVSASSDTASLRAHAALQQSGNLGLLLMNESRTANQSVAVTIAGATLCNAGTQYQFGTNNFSGSSQTPFSGPTTNSISGLGSTFNVTVPAYTMVLITIPLTNTPPSFAAISNYAVNVGQAVAFQASASDSDQPSQSLSFSLLSGPGSASVSSSGAFYWRPAVTDANRTNLISLTVIDSGVPPMSATQSFSVVVNPLNVPVLSSPGLANGQFTLQITGEAGPDYAVLSSTNLVDWTVLFITNSPPMPFLWTNAAAASAPAEFFRVKVGPPLP